MKEHADSATKQTFRYEVPYNILLVWLALRFGRELTLFYPQFDGCVWIGEAKGKVTLKGDTIWGKGCVNGSRILCTHSFGQQLSCHAFSITPTGEGLLGDCDLFCSCLLFNPLYRSMQQLRRKVQTHESPTSLKNLITKKKSNQAENQQSVFCYSQESHTHTYRLFTKSPTTQYYCLLEHSRGKCHSAFYLPQLLYYIDKQTGEERGAHSRSLGECSI